jgi:hypothetical protein
MATELTVMQEVRPLALSTRSQPPSTSWVVKKLGLLALARQAEVGREMLVLYSSELSLFREDDLSIVIRKFALSPREEYTPAFPELGAIVQAVRSERSRREAHEQRERRAAEQHEEMRSRVTVPERWFDSEQVAAGVVEKIRAEYQTSGFNWERPYEPKPYRPEAA